MQKSLSDPPDPDRSRLSPSQADGDLFRLSRSASRRPSALEPEPSPRPASLSEPNLHVHSTQQQQQQQQHHHHHHHHHHAHAYQKTPTSSAARAGFRHADASDQSQDAGGCHCDTGTACRSVPVFSRNSSNTTRASTAATATTIAVPPSPALVGSLQDAWPGTVLDPYPEKETPAPSSATGLSLPLPIIITTPTDTADAVEAVDTVNAAASAATPAAANAAAGGSNDTSTKKDALFALAVSFVVTTRKVLLHSWLNLFLLFVPAGIIVGTIPDVQPAIVFSLNAVAIVPLAGLLSYATETVAHRMGDSIGALLNITFGNAVELIIFIALVKDELRIVQASLLGSILANLLLILGMGFLLGGLRFREQIYNSTVTQMSACLLSLSVISLVLPTAFHASFDDPEKADRESLKISRGTSVILLLVYGIYLLFQLKSHAYMYESTPQHIIDEEATPGPAAAWLDSSSSDGTSSASDSDTSGHSRDTVKNRVRRVIRGRRRRKSSVASLDTESCMTGPTRAPSFSTAAAGNDETHSEDVSARLPTLLRATLSDVNDEVIEEDDTGTHRQKKRRGKRSLYRSHKHRRKSSLAGSNDHELTADPNMLNNADILSHPSSSSIGNTSTLLLAESAHANSARNSESRVTPTFTLSPSNNMVETRRVDFAIIDPAPGGTGNVDEYGNLAGPAADLASARRAFNLRAMPSLRPVAKSLAPTVFTQPVGLSPADNVTTGPIPRIRYGIRRTNSLPDRLNQHQFRPPGAMLPSQIPACALSPDSAKKEMSDDDEFTLSRRAAVIMLLVTTGLVAACAEFMVDSINGLVETSNVSELFIGLIILPIVGNAAEHVTAVMVAMKNKMDLAIGVAVGSSIQIALFMTPLVVILGWAIGRDMTLYFTLFETVCLFVSAFIVNFLVLDGRSNYLEGALLCATYVIISLVAFYYPASEDTSSWG